MDPVDRFAELIGDDYAEGVAYIAAVGRKAKERIEGLDLPAEGYGIIGGDYHAGNNYFAGMVPTFFDFDTSGYGWKVYDLAVFYHNNLLNGSMGDQVYRDYGNYWGFTMDAIRRWDEELSR